MHLVCMYSRNMIIKTRFAKVVESSNANGNFSLRYIGGARIRANASATSASMHRWPLSRRRQAVIAQCSAACEIGRTESVPTTATARAVRCTDTAAAVGAEDANGMLLLLLELPAWLLSRSPD